MVLWLCRVLWHRVVLRGEGQALEAGASSIALQTAPRAQASVQPITCREWDARGALALRHRRAGWRRALHARARRLVLHAAGWADAGVASVGCRPRRVWAATVRWHRLLQRGVLAGQRRTLQAGATRIALQAAPRAHASVQTVPGGESHAGNAPPFWQCTSHLCGATHPGASGLTFFSVARACAGIASIRGGEHRVRAALALLGRAPYRLHSRCSVLCGTLQACATRLALQPARRARARVQAVPRWEGDIGCASACG
mmetsp:Transcript_23197/g.57741  ORF Transcript_23197/g.57741 Transcript_23197/m.57741 type:complete len:257 (+) Transcript_23197:1437-2207(+)